MLASVIIITDTVSNTPSCPLLRLPVENLNNFVETLVHLQYSPLVEKYRVLSTSIFLSFFLSTYRSTYIIYISIYNLIFCHSVNITFWLRVKVNY